MAEPLKNIYTRDFIARLARVVGEHNRAFNGEDFSRQVFARGWRSLELKERMRRISQALNTCLEGDYATNLETVVASVKTLLDQEQSGYEYLFFPDFIEQFGQQDYRRSVAALAKITRLASAEMAVRPFIISEPEKMMNQMFRWSKSRDLHIRRLASEGCRPRLPWAMALPAFKQDPEPILRILEQLKDDDSLYVRRSVANNLNDISKDHPGLVIEIGKRWLGSGEETDWIVKHACRGLLKKADPDTLAMFGFSQSEHLKISGFSISKTVPFGGRLALGFTLKSGPQPIGKLRIEYAIDFMKANGRTARKVFKISESDYRENEKTIQRNHSFKAISTRRYYPGRHGFAVLLNGREAGHKTFILEADSTE